MRTQKKTFTLCLCSHPFTEATVCCRFNDWISLRAVSKGFFSLGAGGYFCCVFFLWISEEHFDYLLQNISISARKLKVAAELWTRSASAETQNDVFDVVCLFCTAAELFGVRAAGQPFHSHPKNTTQITPSPDLLLSKAFSVASPQTHICWRLLVCTNYQIRGLFERMTDVQVEKFSWNTSKDPAVNNLLFKGSTAKHNLYAGVWEGANNNQRRHL